MDTNILLNAATGKAMDLAMQRLEVTGRVYPLGSFIRVTHRFRCMGTKPMEAIYVSMLPTGGVLRRFKVIGENFEVDSKLEKRQKARQEYEAGVSAGHLSVLAEANQDGLVHLSVGQVQPNEEICVIMDVVVGVTVKDRGFQFRFPFTLAPSYHANAKVSATEGGGRIELPEDVFGDLVLPEWKNTTFGLHEVAFNLQVYGGTNLTAVSSPSHRLSTTPQADGSMLVSLAGMGDTPNRDLVLDVSIPEAQKLLFVDAPNPDGTDPSLPQGAPRWTALMPSTIFQKGQQKPRKMCFVLDRSGSMTGSHHHDPKAPIIGAKQALLACLSALQPDDEFGIVHFGNDAQTFHPSLGKADDATRKRATAWVEKIQCSGGTEMLGALAAATRVLGGPGDIFLLTDGQVSQTGPIVEHMEASKSRVHVLGIGTASQHRFMAQLARRTGGVVDMVPPDGDVGVSGLRLFNQVREPVLTDVSVTVDGTNIPNIGNVWDGHPLLVSDPKGDGSTPESLQVGGQVASDFVKVAVPAGLTALLWAGRQIEDLSSKMDMAAEGTPARVVIEQTMTDISVGYSLASQVMSLVAVVERVGDQAGTPEQKIVSLGVPEGQQGFFMHTGLSMHTGPGSYTGNLRGISTTRCRRGSLSGQTLGDPPAGATVTWSTNHSSTGAFDQDLSRSVSFMDVSADMSRGFEPGVYSFTEAVRPAGATGTSDPNEWKYTGNLLVDLAGLMADGGVPGEVLEDRVLHTMTLALIVSMEAQRTPGIYEAHLARMSAFIKANKDCLNEPVVVHKVLAAIKRGVFTFQKRNLEDQFYKVQKDVLHNYRTNL